MLPAPFKQPTTDKDLVNLAQAQTPDRSIGSPATRRQDRKPSKIISRIKEDLCKTATKDGYIYAVQVRENGLVKVGWSGIAGGSRPYEIEDCGYSPGKIFQTTTFKASFRAEKIVHDLLFRWAWNGICPKVCEQKKHPTRHVEYFDCGLGFAISAIDVVMAWFLREPYLIEGEKGALKPRWSDALDVFKESQRSDNPMEWFEFFLIDLESQLAWRQHPPPLKAPRYLPANAAPVQILPNGTLRFAEDKEERPKAGKTPKSSPAVLQTTSSPVQRGRQTGLSESTPPRTSSEWDQRSSPQETPSKLPKHVSRPSDVVPKTTQENHGERAPFTEVDDTELTAATSKLTLADDGTSVSLPIQNFFVKLRISMGY